MKEFLDGMIILIIFSFGIAFVIVDNSKYQYKLDDKKEFMQSNTSTRVDGMQVYWKVKTFPDGHQYGMLLDDYGGLTATRVIHLLHHIDCVKCTPANRFKKPELKKEIIHEERKPLRIEPFRKRDKKKHPSHCDEEDTKRIKTNGNN